MFIMLYNYWNMGHNINKVGVQNRYINIMYKEIVDLKKNTEKSTTAYIYLL